MHRSTEGAQTIDVEICLPGLSEVEAVAAFDGVFEDGPYLEDAPIRGAVDYASIVIVGLVVLDLFVRSVTELACRRRHRHGVIVDARGERVKVEEEESLPGGIVQVYMADGGYDRYNACEKGLDLSPVLRGLGRGK